jgi:mono/diheme cytochrome c family protein
MFFNKKVAAFIISAVIISSCKFFFDTTRDNVTADPATASIANGRNLVFNICAGCHYSESAGKFTGRPLNDLPKIAGKLYSANLTQSATHGIPPKYSDAELFYLLKTGIAKDGKFMPYMMRPMMADEDVKDLIAYLRSNDAAVSPADTTAGISHINLIGKMGIRLASKPTPYKTGVPRPDENNTVEYGRYLVAVTGCYHCHSSSALKVDFLEPEKSKGYMQGGMKLKDPQGNKLRSPNLTPDNETGIGNYTLADFTSAVRTGIAPGGRELSPPMPKLKSLTDLQVNAIYRYIRSLAPVHHKVKVS